jgi:hypothetical protein
VAGQACLGNDGGRDSHSEYKLGECGKGARAAESREGTFGASHRCVAAPAFRSSHPTLWIFSPESATSAALCPADEEKAADVQAIDRSAQGDPKALRATLLAMNGIGPETADSMLLYAGGYPIFVVDAYTRRIGQRQGLFKTNDYHEVQDYFQRHLPKKAALYNEFHAQIVWLAKHYCKKNAPLCGACPVRSGCAYAQARSDS